MNMITHICGGAMGIVVLLLCMGKALGTGSTPAVIGALIYGISMIALYTVSSIYHGMKPGYGKKVMQVVDHCTIYFLIAGSYTAVLLPGMLLVYPDITRLLLTAEWTLAVLAAALTAIDLRIYRAFSMFCYIGMGWGIVFFLPQTLKVMTWAGFGLLLAGGIAYTIGAILYGIGSKKPWMHSVFHIFVVLGSFLQFLSIYFYAL